MPTLNTAGRGQKPAAAYWDGGQTSDTLDTAMLGKGQMMPEKRRFPAVITHDHSVGENQAPPITANNSGDGGRSHVVAFSSKDDGRDAVEEKSPTLRSMNFDQSHINGGGQVAAAYNVALRGRDEGGSAELLEEQATALRASQGGGDKNHVLHPQAFQQNQRNEVRYLEGQVAGALPSNPGMKQQNYIHDPQNLIVRRLTPKECERLQGFPDDWTRWGKRIPGASGKKTDDPDIIEMSNTRRYRALGNAFPVPVVAWILRRIVAIDAAE